MCAVTIMLPLFVYKLGIYDFCADELWISSMLRECILLSLVSSGRFLCLWGEKAPLVSEPAKLDTCKAWETWMLRTGLIIREGFGLNGSVDEICLHLRVSHHSVFINSERKACVIYNIIKREKIP